MAAAFEEDLFFADAAVAQFCGGTWIHVPVLLQVEDTPLIVRGALRATSRR